MKNFYRSIIVLLLVLPLLPLKVSAQQMLTLEECIESARKSNLQLRGAAYSQEAAKTAYRLSAYNYLPNLNFSTNYQFRFGTTFSFITFRRESETIQSSVPGLNSSVDLFKGFQKHYDRKKAEADLQAASFGVEKVANDLQTNIIYAYLQVIYDEENIMLAESRKDLVEKQLERTEKQLAAGTKTKADLYSIKSQLASERLNEVNAKGQREKDMLNLLQLINKDPLESFELQKPDAEKFNIDAVIPDFETVYRYAIQNMPEILEQEKRIVSAEYAVKSARANMYPTLSLSGGVGSQYSSQGVPTIENGQYVLKDIGYFPQLNDNLGGNVGISLNVPIFNNMQFKGAVMNQEFNLLNAQLEKENREQQLLQKIQQAYQDVFIAQARYISSEEQLIALQEGKEFAQKRLDAGVIDFYTYMESVNNHTRAQSELLQAKYDFIVKMKILDLYQGKPLTFE